MRNRAARTLQTRVLEQVRVQGLWSPGQTVAIGVSGGVDSIVLMHLLQRTQRAHGGQLVVVSINHGLRAESASEVEMVRAQCEVLGLPFESRDLRIEKGSNLAERARLARRTALESLGTDRVATAHHRDDQAETVLYHLLRGSGMQGLKGMSARSGVWVRPLLRESKQVLMAWANQEGLQWMDDPSNPASQRGELRRLMPALDAVHGGAAGALARSARLLAREDAFLSRLADEAWERSVTDQGLDRRRLAEAPEAVQLRLLRRLVDDPSVRADPLEAVVAGALEGNGRLDLGGGMVLRCQDGHLTVERPQ